MTETQKPGERECCTFHNFLSLSSFPKLELSLCFLLCLQLMPQQGPCETDLSSFEPSSPCGQMEIQSSPECDLTFMKEMSSRCNLLV